MSAQRKVRTCLWFARRGIDAAQFYVTLLPDSGIDAVFDHGQPDDPLVVEFTLAGAPMMILTGGDMFQHSPAASISVLTKDQAETDQLWAALPADGGKQSMCGWLSDRFGVSWQIVPEILPRLLNDPDTAAASRARTAMMQMKKIDIAALEAAFHSA
jgi:predicted 3-demethylubiquinone-9 3-methyltransferase (glyoxalase superfamily)